MLDKLLFGVSTFTDVCTCIGFAFFAIDAHVLSLLNIRQVDTEYLANQLSVL